MLPVSNPATARALVRMGADTLNFTTDLSLAQIAAIRAVVDVPLDIYVEVPDNETSELGARGLALVHA